MPDINLFGMSHERYSALMDDDVGALTKEEMEAGWHFCPEWDFLLTNYNDPEGEHCTCPHWTAEELEKP